MMKRRQPKTWDSAGMTVVLSNKPANYRRLLGRAADGVEFPDRFGSRSSLVHFFARRSELERKLRC
ncbi:MAG: hypothetical protein DME66_02960 [Verrucomicrobia bacterium]|nr:MAG: hypothetical protein DME66_02960 [Verrucomicrobiota bacterium]